MSDGAYDPIAVHLIATTASAGARYAPTLRGTMAQYTVTCHAYVTTIRVSGMWRRARILGFQAQKSQAPG